MGGKTILVSQLHNFVNVMRVKKKGGREQTSKRIRSIISYQETKAGKKSLDQIDDRQTKNSQSIRENCQIIQSHPSIQTIDSYEISINDASSQQVFFFFFLLRVCEALVFHRSTSSTRNVLGKNRRYNKQTRKGKKKVFPKAMKRYL